MLPKAVHGDDALSTENGFGGARALLHQRAQFSSRGDHGGRGRQLLDLLADGAADEEVERNPRARSALLRAAEKVR